MMMKMRNLLAAAALLVSSAAVVFAPAPVVAQDEEENRPRRSQTLDPAVARVLQTVFENIQAEEYQAAQGQVTQLLQQRGERMKAYDLATTYELDGQIKVNLENYRGALRSFQRALDANGLPPVRNNQLRYFIAQLYFQLEDYQAAIRGLNNWINLARQAGEPVDANAYYLLAAAYTQIQPPNFAAARRPAEQTLEAREEPRKNDYDLMNLVYSELNATSSRLPLLERMVGLWPNEKSYWRQLSGLHASSGNDRDAFSVLEVAYRAGLLDEENDVLNLIRYYSFFDNPYRGAKLLDREIQAGTVKRSVQNLQLLSQLWSQSREHKRAIPILEEAAGRSSTGELSYRLGQVLLADEQYGRAERALARARRQGGLRQRQLADTWMLSGTARFSVAGPDDCAGRARARTAFQNATRYDSTGREARQWVAYIDAIDSTVEAQDRLAFQQANEERKATIDRLRQQVTVCKLQGGGPDACAELEGRLAELINEDREAQTSPPAFGCTGGARTASDETSDDDAAEDADEASESENG